MIAILCCDKFCGVKSHCSNSKWACLAFNSIRSRCFRGENFVINISSRGSKSLMTHLNTERSSSLSCWIFEDCCIERSCSERGNCSRRFHFWGVFVDGKITENNFLAIIKYS